MLLNFLQCGCTGRSSRSPASSIEFHSSKNVLFHSSVRWLCIMSLKSGQKMIIPSAPSRRAASAVSTDRTNAAVMKGLSPQSSSISLQSRINLVGSPPTSLYGSQNGRTWVTPASATAAAWGRVKTVVQNVGIPAFFNSENAPSA